MIIDLLKQKNTYLTQFSRLSIGECQRLKKGDFSRINEFCSARQKILKSIAKIDAQIQTYKEAHLSEQEKKDIIQLLKEKRSIVCSIVQQDLLIHCYVNEQKLPSLKDRSA